jgi:hypothetical protein
MLLNYLEAVVVDEYRQLTDAPVGVPHSDRTRVLLAYLREQDNRAAEEDRRLLREAAALEAYRAAALGRIAQALAVDGLDCLVLKGAAFSYTAYPAPHLRPRNDEDLWVRASDFERACGVLERCGYTPQVELTSSEVTRQRHFTSVCAPAHQVDLHWWPVNPSAFDSLPTFDACRDQAVALAAVGPDVYAPGPVHALLLACAHRVAHHTATEDAMWHCDVHFLADTLQPGDWVRFEAEARSAAIARICGVELSHARATLGTPVPAALVERLLAVEGEASARYLRSLGPLRDLWLELAARETIASRVRLLTEHVFPPRHYVAARYGYRGVALLPLFYAHRAVNGFAHWTAELVSRLAR